MDLMLLEATGLTLRELDTMNPRRKWRFACFISARRRAAREERGGSDAGGDGAESVGVANP